eukprot:scaffold1991_cov218-Pinguiococcus_pyrenoidosus.AAC.5
MSSVTPSIKSLPFNGEGTSLGCKFGTRASPEGRMHARFSAALDPIRPFSRSPDNGVLLEIL